MSGYSILRSRLLTILGLLGVFCFGLITAIGSGGGGNGGQIEQLPVLNVISQGTLTQEDADRLFQVLGVSPSWELVNGNITYIDRDRFLAVPATDGGSGPADTDGSTTIRKLDLLCQW